MDLIEIEVCFDVDVFSAAEQEDIRAKTEKAIRHILAEAGVTNGKFEIDVISDETIHAANAAWLEHDYPTDVLAFEMDRDEGVHKLEGNILVSSEMAAVRAPEFGWGTFEELMLYIIHGTLHLVGFDDHEGGDAAAMHQKENEALAVIGIKRARP